MRKITAILCAATVILISVKTDVLAEDNEAYSVTRWEEGDYYYDISSYKAGSQKKISGNRILSSSGEMNLADGNKSYWGDLVTSGYAKGKEKWEELFRGYVPKGTILKIHFKLHSCEHEKNTYAGIRIANIPDNASDSFRKVSVDVSGCHPMWSDDRWATTYKKNQNLENVKTFDMRVLGNDKGSDSDLEADLVYECLEEGEYKFEVYGYVQHCSHGANTLEVGGVGETGIVPFIPPNPIGEYGEYRIKKGSAGNGASLKLLNADGQYSSVCSVVGGNGAASVDRSNGHVCKVLEASSFGGRVPESGYYDEAKGGGTHLILNGNQVVESKTENGSVFGRIVLIGEPNYTPSKQGGEKKESGAQITPIPAIRFHGNGGSGEMADEIFGSGFDGVSLTPCAYQKSGKTFAGWSLDEKGGEIVFLNQSPIGRSDFFERYKIQTGKEYAGGMLDLFAVWQ